MQTILGAHVSIAGGIEQALYRAAALGCNVMQIFTHNNRQWANKLYSQESIRAFKAAQEQTHIYHVIAHASYLINLGSTSAETVAKSLKALEIELTQCDQLGIPYLVLHPGSGLPDATLCMDQIASRLNMLFKKYTGATHILLELMAGQGTSVGYTFEQLAYIRSEVHEKQRIGICFDTCHAWAAGYDFSHEILYNKMWQHFDTTIGLDNLKALHINDSRTPRGSHVDRHEDIGKGTMGLNTFRLIMNDPRLTSLVKVIETPKETPEEDKINLDTLKSLVSRLQ